jgi:hypothetical protein
MSRVERERQNELAGVVDRRQTALPVGGAVVLATTTAVTAYPTTAGVFYGATPTEIDGAESEGSAATYTVDTYRLIYILNQGTQVPPIGTRVLAHAVGGRWVFRYDG